MYNASDENDFRKIVEPWSHKVQKAANRVCLSCITSKCTNGPQLFCFFVQFMDAIQKLTNVDTSTPIGSSQERRAARDFNIY